jgi:hypothetical protein
MTLALKYPTMLAATKTCQADSKAFIKNKPDPGLG